MFQFLTCVCVCLNIKIVLAQELRNDKKKTSKILKFFLLFISVNVFLSNYRFEPSRNRT